MKITQQFLDGLKKASEKKEKDIQSGKNFFNIFDAIIAPEKEASHTYFIAYLLNPSSEHYQSVFLESFLDSIKAKVKNATLKNALNAKNIDEVKAEKSTDDKRRIDIHLGFKDNTHIILENKIHAADSDRQIRDYVENFAKKGVSSDKILVIYLNKYGKNPSENSLKPWRIENNILCNRNGTKKAELLVIDYNFIKSWLTSCLKDLRKSAETKARGSEKTRGENGLNKVIFGIEQYIDILDWYILDIWEEEFPVRDFILESNENKQMALSLLNDKNAQMHDVVKREWDLVNDAILYIFYENIESKLQKGIKIGNETYVGYRTDSSNFYGDIFWIYKKSNEDLEVRPIYSFSLYAWKNNESYKVPSFGFLIGWWWENDDERQANEKIADECKAFFPKKSGFRKDGTGYYKTDVFGEKFDEELLGDYALSTFIIENGDNAENKFIESLKHFINLDSIKETSAQCEKFLHEKLDSK